MLEPMNATLAELNKRSEGYLPGLIGMEIVELVPDRLSSRLEIRPELLAPNGYLHAATVVALADTSCGYGTVAHLPDGAKGFTTIELKINFTGTVRAGAISCTARPLHKGRSTQLWDALVTDENTGREVAHFRCTQIILW